MTIDALDPGPNGDFPWLPRLPDGRLDTTAMPIGHRWQDGKLIDVTPSVRLPDGRLVPITDVCAP